MVNAHSRYIAQEWNCTRIHTFTIHHSPFIIRHSSFKLQHSPWAKRQRIAAACASYPSRVAKRTTVGAKRRNPARVAETTLVRLTKSYTPSGEKKRAVPPVGR